MQALNLEHEQDLNVTKLALPDVMEDLPEQERSDFIQDVNQSLVKSGAEIYVVGTRTALESEQTQAAIKLVKKSRFTKVVRITGDNPVLVVTKDAWAKLGGFSDKCPLPEVVSRFIVEGERQRSFAIVELGSVKEREKISAAERIKELGVCATPGAFANLVTTDRLPVSYEHYRT